MNIMLDTGTAVGGFQAPWSIEGKITALDETRRRFDLRFNFTVPVGGEVQKSSMRLYGTAQFAAADFPLPGSTGLEGWDLSWREEKDRVSGEAKTLDELRALLRAD